MSRETIGTRLALYLKIRKQNWVTGSQQVNTERIF